MGKLRRFNWLIDSTSGSFGDSDEHRVFHHEGNNQVYLTIITRMVNHVLPGPFRVNAIKNHYGVWVEYPSGKKVTFHHFPHFNTVTLLF